MNNMSIENEVKKNTAAVLLLHEAVTALNINFAHTFGSAGPVVCDGAPGTPPPVDPVAEAVIQDVQQQAAAALPTVAHIGQAVNPAPQLQPEIAPQLQPEIAPQLQPVQQPVQRPVQQPVQQQPVQQQPADPELSDPELSDAVCSEVLQRVAARLPVDGYNRVVALFPQFGGISKLSEIPLANRPALLAAVEALQ